MEIREAVPGDAASIAGLALQLGYPAAVSDVEARLRAIGGDAGAAALVAFEDDAVIGWIHVHDTVVLQSPPFAALGGLVVDERRRGERVGEALLEAAEAWARDRGHREVRVRSNVVRERAHGFYRRLGYTVEKTSSTFHKRL